MGNIIALSLGGILCVYGFDGGWPSIFYIFGLSGIVWSVLMLTLASDSPVQHTFIGKREKEFIVEETKKSINIKNVIKEKKIFFL